jgi:hypothetical protein
MAMALAYGLEAHHRLPDLEPRDETERFELGEDPVDAGA